MVEDEQNMRELKIKQQSMWKLMTEGSTEKALWADYKMMDILQTEHTGCFKMKSPEVDQQIPVEEFTVATKAKDTNKEYK